MFFRLVEALFFTAALSLDAFAASLAFGAQGIRVPFSSVAIVSAVCSGVMSLSLLLGTVAQALIPERAAAWGAFCILTVLGVARLFDGMLKAWIRKGCNRTANVEFQFLSFHFLLCIYADSTQADMNRSKSISAGEAASLAVALSLDGLATGFGAGLAAVSLPWAAALSLLLGVAAVELGCRLGRKMAGGGTRDFSWAGGAVLIVLGVLKLV